MSKTLYIIHGWTYRPEPWQEVIKELKTAHHIDAELLRVPGLGTKSAKTYNINDYVEWAKRNIPQGGIALGHSNGGRILLNLLSGDSSYLSGLILLDSAGVYEKSIKRSLSRAASKLLSPLKKITVLRKLAHKILGANDYAAAPENMKHTLSNMLESDKYLDITKVKTPTAIIWGAADDITPLRQGKTIHDAIKGSSLTVKPGWRHSHYLVSTSELATEIAKAYASLTESKHA
ncbi:alpha/beta hydrolase [Candidatus Saccharibacteria bacterium]|nr:alpha/beta hydrolase [Candidatus Saccharibacteria bacterium]